jgi:hypothetical protein
VGDVTLFEGEPRRAYFLSHFLGGGRFALDTDCGSCGRDYTGVQECAQATGHLLAAARLLCGRVQGAATNDPGNDLGYSVLPVIGAFRGGHRPVNPPPGGCAPSW